MKEITLQPLNQRIAVSTGGRLLDTLLANRCNVLMACGGQGICATCHVHVTQGREALTPLGDRERRTLALITGANDQSRLACQCRILDDGVEVRLPDGMYVQSFNDIESLVGRRTQVPILHPADGRILIQGGKFITRSAIMQLAEISFDPGSIHTTRK